MAKSRAPRQRDIALHAGVSQAAVSMVLNGRGNEMGIPESTQLKIKAAMRDLSYVPNAAAQSLRGGRNNLVGVHTFEQVFPVHPNDYYREFLTGIEEQATEMGLDLVLFASTQNAAGRSIYGGGTNRLRIADGTVILGFRTNDDELARLAREGHPFVFIGKRTISGVDVPYVTADYDAATSEAVRLLRAHGHTSLLYLGDSTRGPARDERLDAFRSATSDLAAAHVQLMAEPEVTASWLREALSFGFTALVLESRGLATSISLAMQEAGLSSPRDVSVVSLDAAADLALSSVGVPRREMGRAAVTLLNDFIDGRCESDEVRVIACSAPTLITIEPVSNTLVSERTS